MEKIVLRCVCVHWNKKINCSINKIKCLALRKNLIDNLVRVFNYKRLFLYGICQSIRKKNKHSL